MKPPSLNAPLALGLAVALLPTARADWAPFGIPAALPDHALVAAPPAPVGARAPRVVVDGDHFAVAGDRYRVWGVNLCFGANLPTPAEAALVARRLAALGINSVRLHHLDTIPYPAGLPMATNALAVHPEARERLDAFLDQLARNGIRVNLNLHVGRRASRPLGLPKPGGDCDKIVDLFTPALIAAQKDYARDLLSHTNRFRGVTWAADPAVAFVEISNEDSLFMWDADKRLRSLPPYYAEILQSRYADWLRQKYRATSRLRDAWAPGAETLGTNLLSGRVSEPGANPSWQLEVHLPAEASLAVDPAAQSLTVRVRKPDRVDWHIQLQQSPLTVEAGRYYTLTFRARATKPRPLSVGVSMNHAPWGSLGLWHWTSLTTNNWVAVRTGFAATTNDARARLAFVVGAAEGDVEIADVALRPGGRLGLAAGESLDAQPPRLFGECETEARSLDRVRFLADTEKAFFDAMRQFIRTDLRCQALVTGTVVFGPASLYTQSDMDYLDAHAYWQHPHFPGRPWDPVDWVVEQQAMVDHPEWATLPPLACGRLEGKPYTVSEYNHPAPNDFQAECVPLIASTAAAQGWDGVWLFAYASSAGAGHDRFESFFDIDANPAKLGFLPAGAALFRDGLMAPLSGSLTFGRGPRNDPLSAASLWQEQHANSLVKTFGDGGQDPLTALRTYRLALSWRPGLRIKLPTTRPSATRVRWTMEQGKGAYVVESAGGLAWAGWSNPAATSGVRVVTPAFAAVTVSPLDGRDLASSGRLLIAACGRCENTDQAFSADRRSVGKNWGRAPVRIETVTGRVPLPPGRWRLWALGPDGLKRGEAAVTEHPREPPQAELESAHGTLWYLADRL